MQCGACGHENRDGARFCDECGTSLAPAPTASPELPRDLAGGRYRVERFLGEGARKRVYLTHDTRLDRPVAVAVVKTDGLDEAGRRRIDREARAMARLGDHPNIVTVYDVVDDDGVPQIVSQYVGGGTLADRLDDRPDRRLPVEEAVRIGEQLALALSHAHALGIVHRDLKPANVWLDVDGSARLGDFGLAALTDESRITSEGMVVGTVAYLAPEQATGRPADTRADLYALGALLYELLTGRPPFMGDDAVAVISQHLNTAPMAPAWHNADVPRVLDTLVLELLAKDPDDRPASADVVAAALRSVRSEPTGPAPSSATSPAPATAADWRTFVGRDDELAIVRAACDDAIGGRSRLVLVLGEPGIGKTRLVEEATGYAAVRGAQVCWGHCYDGEVGVPYLPFVEAFRSYVRGHDDDELRAELGNEAPEIATMVSELRHRFPDIPVPPPLDADAERLRLFDGVATFLGNASREHPIVIVLDDLHWADKPTLLMLQYLARHLRHERIAIIGTYRDVDLDRQHPLADTITELRRERLYERVVLRGLSRDGVKDLIEAIGGQSTPDRFADTVYRATEGNPFFVAEVLRHLVDTGALRFVDGQWVGTAEGVAENLPEGVREVIGRRLSRLSDDANAMLTVAAAMPGGFTLPVVGTVSGEDEDRVLDLLDEALDAQIVRERARHVGTYEFSHALIRQTLYGELSTPRRVRLHRQIGEALEELPSTAGEAPLAELAYHWFQAAPSGHVEKAVDYARRAGDRARGAAAHDEAARFYDQALQALELLDEVDEHLRAELLLEKGSALRLAGETVGADAALDESAALARRLGDSDLLAQAALAATAGFWAGADDDARSAVLEEALRVVGPDRPALRSRLLSRLSSFYLFRDAARCEELAHEAVALARTAGDATALALALYATSWTVVDEHSDEIDRIYDEITRLLDESPTFDIAATSQMGPVLRAEIRSDRAALLDRLAAYERIVVRTRAPSWAAMFTQLEAQIAVLEGRYDEGEELGLKILEHGRRVGDPSAITNYGICMLVPWREQGRVEPLVEPTRRAVERSPKVPAWRSGLAQLYLTLGQVDDAQRALDELAEMDFVMPNDPGLRYGLCAAAEVAAALADRPRCEHLYELLLPHAGLGVLLGPAAYHGVADRYLGLLATALGRYDDAIAHHEAALVLLDRLGARAWKARTQHDLAVALLDRGSNGDAPRALVLLNEALDAAQQIGMSVLVDQVLPRKLELQGIESGSSLDASIDAVSAAVQGERPDLRRHAAVDGHLTLCFSDIEDYTVKTDRLGDVAMQGVLRAHNDILRRALAVHGGVEVKSQGDGFMLAFTEPTAAVRFALDFQRDIDAHDFGADAGTIRVRVGIHTGVVLREGDDFFGRTVIVAARVADRAEGGEILITDDVRDAIDGAIALGPSRDVELKGFSGTRTVHPVAR